MVTDPYRSPSATVRDATEVTVRTDERASLSGLILVPAALGLGHFAATVIGPFFGQLVLSAFVMLVSSSSKELFDFLIPVYGPLFFYARLTITAALQTLLIYGAWALSRTRRFSFLLMIGVLFLVDTGALVWLEQHMSFAAVVSTVFAVGISYLWARATYRKSGTG